MSTPWRRAMTGGMLAAALLLTGPACTVQDSTSTPTGPEATAPATPPPGDRVPGAPVLTPPGPEGTSMPTPGAGAPGDPSLVASPAAPAGGQNPEIKSVAILELVADPGNPLKLTDAEKKELGQAIFQMGLALDQANFRQGVLYGLLQKDWKTILQMDWTADSTPEADFLRTSEAALKVLDEKAGSQRADASPLPKELQEAASLTEPVDPREGEFEKAIPTDKRLSLMQLGHLLEQVAPTLDAATAARVAAETRAIVANVQEMDRQWEIIRRIATEGGRSAQVATEVKKTQGKIPNLPEANQKAQLWADGVRG